MGRLKDDKILEHWARYFKTQLEKEYSEEEESDEEVFLTAESLVKERRITLLNVTYKIL